MEFKITVYILLWFMAYRSCQMSTYMSGLSVRVLRLKTTFPAKTKKLKL